MRKRREVCTCTCSSKCTCRMHTPHAHAPHAHATRNMLHAQALSRLRILNVSELTSLRGDGHCERCTDEANSSKRSGQSEAASTARARDCLHFCLPGPVDTWSAMLQEELLLLQED